MPLPGFCPRPPLQPEFEYLDKFGLVWSYHVKQFEKSMMKSQNTCEIPEDEDDEECGSVFLTAEIQGGFFNQICVTSSVEI